MITKILVAGILGGIAMFVWSSIAHMVLPIGEAGIKQISSEEPVLNAIKENIKEDGFYFFPAMTEGMNNEAWLEKYRTGPSGIMIVHPNGEEPMTAGMLIVEFLSDIIAVLIAVFLLSKTTGNLERFWKKVWFITFIGFIPFLIVDVSYWNWYGFSGSYTIAQLVDQVVGFFAAGLVIAWRFKPKAVIQ